MRKLTSFQMRGGKERQGENDKTFSVKIPSKPMKKVHIDHVAPFIPSVRYNMRLLES